MLVAAAPLPLCLPDISAPSAWKLCTRVLRIGTTTAFCNAVLEQGNIVETNN